MQTNFEKKVRDKLHDFRLEPSNHVWKDISSSLDAPKKRRVAVWWMFAAGFATIGLIAAGIWMADYHSLSPAKNNIAEKANSHSNQPAPVITNSNSQIDHSGNDNILSQTNHSTQKNSITADAGEISNQKENAATKKDQHFDLSSIALQNQNNIAKKYDEKNNTIPYFTAPVLENTVANNTSSSNNNSVFLNSSHNNSVSLNTDKNKTAESDLQKTVTTDLQKNNSLPQKMIPATASVKQVKRSHWSFLFGGGSTNTVNENLLFAKSKPLIYHNNSGANDTVKSMRPAYPGFHITGGIQYSVAINTRWTLYSGLQYSFLLNHQRTGKQVSQESEISSAADTLAKAQQFYKILSHYADGTSELNINYASWLEMPVGFGYKINPRSKVSVELRAGASFTHMFADKWLIPDGRYNKFYYSNDLTNNYIVNAHEDIVITLPKHKIIGLQFQHSITSLGKSPVQPALYWNNISLFTTIPLK